MAYEWVSPLLSFIGGLAGSVVTLKIGLNNFKLSKQSLKQQRIINKMNLKNAQKINEQNLKAEVIVKSRMEWINDTKDYASEFCISCTELLYILPRKKVYNDAISEYVNKKRKLVKSLGNSSTSTFKNDLIEISKLSPLIDSYISSVDEIEVKSKEHILNARKKQILLDLNFSNYKYENNKKIINQENQEVTDKVKSLLKNVGNLDKDNSDSSLEFVDFEIRELTIIIDDYIKREWEKVKRIE